MAQVSKKPQDDVCFPQFLNNAFNLSAGLKEKLAKCRFRLKFELELFSNKELIERFNFTHDEILEIDCKIRRKTQYIGLSVVEYQKEIHYISSGSSGLDGALGGKGLPTGMLTQVSGEAGVGKSQICMQLCFRVQLNNRQGGIGGEALYLHTEDSFRPERIHQMATNYFRQTTEESLLKFKADEVLTRVHTRKVNTSAEDLMDIILNGDLDSFFDFHSNIKLLIIDSIAYHFRYTYDHHNDIRVQQLVQIASKLKQFAHQRNVAVLVTNQVTFGNIPALGTLWNSICSTSLKLSRSTNELEPIQLPVQQRFTRRECSVLKSPNVRRSYQCSFFLTENGIED